TNESPIVVRSQAPHLLTSADEVMVDASSVPNASSWRVLILDETHFALLHTEPATSPETSRGGRWQRVRSKVRPYFQAAPVRKDRIISSAAGDKPAAIENAGARLQPGDYIRISKVDDDRGQLLVGDWCLIEHDGLLRLFRPSFGNG